MDRACSQNGGKQECFQNLTGKPTRKRRLGRPNRRWENNIRMDLEEICINAGNWADSAQDKDYCECGIESPGSISHGVSQLYYYYYKKYK